MSKNESEERDQEAEELNEMPDEEVPGEEAGVQACMGEDHEEAHASSDNIGLELLAVDEFFAPGIEQLEITYNILNLEGDTVWLEVTGTDYPGDLVYQRELAGTEKATGDGKKLNWQGKGNQGAKLSGEWISPLFSPYTVVLRAGSGLRSEGETKVELESIELEVEAPENQVIINDPEEKVLVTTKVLIRTKAGGSAVTPIELEVTYIFMPAGGNINSVQSFAYQGTKRLGKRGDASAIYWEEHSDSKSSSDDGYLTKCGAETISDLGGDYGVAKIWFKPSGVGGNTYGIRSQVFASDGTTSLAVMDSSRFEVWRKMDYSNVYTMDGESFVDTATTYDEIAPAFETDAFTLYSRDTVTTLDASLTVKYIGLYKSGGGMKDWPDDLSPEELESSDYELRPTADELADYASDDAAKKAAAKAAIEAKAQLWFNAIVADYGSCIDDWFSDAAVSGGNSILGVRYYHPKLSNQGDGATNFWPAGIRINLANPGSRRNQPGHPDQATWREVLGFNQGTTSVIFKNYPDAVALQATCRHEIGHATRNVFKRADFGGGDHSASGLMQATIEGVNTFSNAEVKILRGFKP